MGRCRHVDVVDLGGTVELARALLVGHPYPADLGGGDAGRTRAEHARQAAERAKVEGQVRSPEVTDRQEGGPVGWDGPPPF